MSGAIRILIADDQQIVCDGLRTLLEAEDDFVVTSGFTNREIAERLAISGDTVKHHLTRIYGKVGVSNRLELALFAISRNLIPHR